MVGHGSQSSSEKVANERLDVCSTIASKESWSCAEFLSVKELIASSSTAT